MGPGWPKKFPNTSRKLGAGDTEGAAAGLTDSAWYGQVGKRAPVITGMVRNSKVTARDGGIFDGPTKGYSATLHGQEAVVPLPDGNKIPVTFGNMPKAPDLETAMKSAISSAIPKPQTSISPTTAPEPSSDQLAYNQLRAQLDSADFMRSGDNTYADVSPEVTAATETMKQKLAEIAATLKTKGINAAAEYDAPDPTVPAIGSIMSLLERIEMADIHTAKSSEMPDFKSVMDN